MPIQPTYPGVYIEELASGVRTITGVATSIAAFVGRAVRGPVNEPVTVYSYADYERNFGGISDSCTMSYAVRDFFGSGGGQAIIVRVHASATTTQYDIASGGMGTNPLTLEAANPGAWGNKVTVSVTYDTSDPDNTFNLIIKDGNTGDEEVVRNLSKDASNARRVDNVLSVESRLVRYRGTTLPTNRPLTDPTAFTKTDANDGGDVTDALVLGTSGAKTGIYALDKTDLFNLLCLPPPKFGAGESAYFLPATWKDAAKYCFDRRALLIVDPKDEWATKAQVSDPSTGVTVLTSVMEYKKNAAFFFPHLLTTDTNKNPLRCAPCGAVAGVMARTDAERGVWKAPAGMEAGIGASLRTSLTDMENGGLNQVAINCLRNMPGAGNVVWGARTLAGDDRFPNDWKYIPVRRTALFIEESLYRGTKWVVFEPNDEPLWAQIRLNIGAFMNNLFRQGAFQGKTPKEAYFVKCDKDTTTQNDINLGIVNILVGFAPLKPAEFVMIKLQQMAGQITT